MEKIKVLKRKDVMAKLNISYATLWRLEKKGLLNPFKYFDKGHVFYIEEEVNEFIEKSSINTNPQAV